MFSPTRRSIGAVRWRPTCALAAVTLAGTVVTTLLAAAVGGASGQPPSVAPAAPIAPALPISPDPMSPSMAGCRSPWVAPVEAPVVDPFRPPSDPFGPGNRGLEYGTTPGQPVSAVAAGLIVFAGPVGGAPVVTIDHGGGLRSTYTRLVGATATRGQVVASGEVVATADEAFHLGALFDRRYIDPAILLDQTCIVIRLVPT